MFVRDEDDMSLGRQILPVAHLPDDFDGIPEDGLQYLFTVRRDARTLPHVTRVPNPYEIPERLPHPPSDTLPPVHPALPTEEWCELLQTRFKNFRKNLAQPTIHVLKGARSNNRKAMPDLKERDLWWAFLSGKPIEDWDPPKKYSPKKFQRGMRAFEDDDSRMEGPSGGSSHEASEARPMRDDSEAVLLSATSLPTEHAAEYGVSHPEHSGGAMPIYKPLEPTPSLLRLIDHRMALHLLMYFTHWTNLHRQPGRRHRVTQTHARWIFALLSRVDDYLSADEMHLLRSLTRAYLGLLKDSQTERAAPDDITPACCWIIISTVVGVWGQRDLWTDAAEIVRLVNQST
ncbi:hypothetical protein GGX14DRAFT_613018 [Mycena pura]|uniref:Uncharacterized protein n=1 Tax=Mycena pura TaxID=153505 RepID=A0AAD6YSZ0_9AGAR|nr:hypothetical protein GGX14DRAFT_613018 [Mycena pura]